MRDDDAQYGLRKDSLKGNGVATAASDTAENAAVRKKMTGSTIQPNRQCLQKTIKVRSMPKKMAHTAYKTSDMFTYWQLL
jgi:hypothetical protein